MKNGLELYKRIGDRETLAQKWNDLSDNERAGMTFEEWKIRQTWEELTEHYAISAREYFYILRLALYHVDGIRAESSYEVAQALKSAGVYECAIKILNGIYKE